MIYLDHATTSRLRPSCVREAMTRYLEEIGVSPNRAGHGLSIEAGRIVFEAREAVASLFGVNDPLRVIFTSGATESINLLLTGLLDSGDHVVTSSMEHNAAARPLRALERSGVRVTIVACDGRGGLDPGDLRAALAVETKLVFLNHASNVNGTVQPIEEIGRIVRDHGALFAVDAAQSAGWVDLDLASLGVDLLAFTGHKSLLGPPGTGGLLLGDRITPGRLRPLIRGGTGSRSSEDIQPEFLPDAFESGTPNTVGIAGLGAAVRYLLERRSIPEADRIFRMAARLRSELQRLDRISVQMPSPEPRPAPVVSFSAKGVSVSDVGRRLEEDHGILSRVGLHCAPWAHRALGTGPEGSVRFSLGMETTEDEIDRAIEGVRSIVGA